MVCTISVLVLNKLRGYLLLKWRDFKNCLFSSFLAKIPVEIYQGLQGAKIDHCILVDRVYKTLEMTIIDSQNKARKLIILLV